MRKVRDGGKKREKKRGKKKEKRLMEIVATTSLPAVDRPNADHWNAALSRQFKTVLRSLYTWAHEIQEYKPQTVLDLDLF